jgi:hypothetical protein
MAQLAELLATLATGLFSGAAIYITLVEHPARARCDPAVALAQFRPSYRRATAMQAPLALIGALAGLARWVVGGGAGWLIGGLLIGAVIPFTLIVILPTTRRLLDPSVAYATPGTTALLARWARLHAIRSLAGLAAFVLFVALLVEG